MTHAAVHWLPAEGNGMVRGVIDPAVSLLLVLAAAWFAFVAFRALALWWAPLPLTAATVTLAAGAWIALLVGDWWQFPAVILLVVLVGVLWEVCLAERAGRISWVARTVAGWCIRRGRAVLEGKRLQTMDEIRAEYGQTVLDDAARDPDLDRILSDLGVEIAQSLRQPRDGGLPLPMDDVTLTLFANGYLDSLSEPGNRPAGRVYGGYSPHMLTLAALCRLAEHVRSGAARMRCADGPPARRQLP